MNKNNLNENNKLNYERKGDFLTPCLTLKSQNILHIGVWANRHRQYLKQHHRVRYYNLLRQTNLIITLPT